jgi:hypothetical protein
LHLGNFPGSFLKPLSIWPSLFGQIRSVELVKPKALGWNSWLGSGDLVLKEELFDLDREEMEMGVGSKLSHWPDAKDFGELGFDGGGELDF